MEFPPVFSRLSAAFRESAVIAVAVIIMMIYLSVKAIAMPRPGADEDAAREPLGSVVAIGSAAIRRRFIVPVGANRRRSDGDRNLCGIRPLAYR
jgi:hypothetical protein